MSTRGNDQSYEPIEVQSTSQWNMTLRSASGQTTFVDFHATWVRPRLRTLSS
jgi:hypothetical protein